MRSVRRRIWEAGYSRAGGACERVPKRVKYSAVEDESVGRWKQENNKWPK